LKELQLRSVLEEESRELRPRIAARLRSKEDSEDTLFSEYRRALAVKRSWQFGSDPRRFWQLMEESNAWHQPRSRQRAWSV